MNRIKIALAASVALALAFTISCSDDKEEEKNPYCIYKDSAGNGFCMQGGITESVCKQTALYTWEADGGCPPDETAKCPSPYYAEGFLYVYGENYVDMCSGEE